MAVTYDPTMLQESPLYQVRFRLGDTDITAASFQDEEILFALSVHCVSALLPRMAEAKKFTVGPYTEEQSTRSYDYWSKLLDELKSSLTNTSAPIMKPPTGPAIFYHGMQSVYDRGYFAD